MRYSLDKLALYLYYIAILKATYIEWYIELNEIFQVLSLNNEPV